ncbi:glycoside hydrolase family 3 protein [Streptomyces gossypiisoli]|uniref:glycoside hydrolase family 3 protein n=1 Tax=Streptomyces gossypiisoli TaxID=2748864 RepID=UPI0015DAA256|nr:glycoside hydrolase family 3 C-terminal domain-containing protein [Streptomyces gossypiisoli]
MHQPRNATPPAHSRREVLRILGRTASAVTLLALLEPVATARPATAAPAAGSVRVRALLARLTLDEKISLVHGATDPERLGQAGYLPGVPRLGIPELRLSDGPAGINVAASATGLPPVSTLAASFNRQLAREYGEVMGREGRTLRMDVLLAPQVELCRAPYFSRNKDQTGEDIYLNAQLAAAQIEGVQAQGMLAMAKHYLANNQRNGEFNRANPDDPATNFDFRVDDRTLHEIYLPGWEAAVRAGVAAVMAAYNHLNGEWNAENRTTLTDILRGELGFTGFVTSDWGATHSVCVEDGLDMEMPGGSYFGDPLKQAVQDGTIPESALDTAVSRILGQYDRFGILDGSRPPARRSVDIAAGARTARRVATQGAVLLANDGGLPLDRAALRSLSLIGPTAAQVAVSVWGERAYGFEDRMVSPLDALRRTAHVEPRYAVGVDLTGHAVPSEVLTPADGTGHGLTRTPAAGGAQVTDATVDFTGDRSFPVGSSYVWTGTLTPPSSGEYRLMIQAWRGTADLYLDDTRIARAASPRDNFARKWSSIVPTTDGLDNALATATLTGGKAYKVRIALTGWAATVHDRGPVQVRFAWVTPEQRTADIRAAARLARQVHTPVVFAFNGSAAPTGGGGDRTSLALPVHQDELIDAVAGANRRTIVVLNVGDPVTMPWRDKVGTILLAGYSGQEGGWATADLLLGRANPSGKLTMTYPKREADHPVLDPAHPERYHGVNGVVTYSEGIFTGYRHFDRADVEPLFCFGHGLSYTRFAYERLSVRAARGGGLDVSFTLTNRGRRSGAEVPQVYVGPAPDAPVEMPVKTLATFDRVELRPGESRRITLRVDERRLSYWSTGDRRWVLPAGRRTVQVGSSSRDIRLTATGRPR